MSVATVWIDEKKPRVAGAMQRLGGLGFWIQLIFLVIVLLLAAVTFVVTGSGGRATIANVLSFLGLALPAFTTFWCMRYRGIGQRMAEGQNVTPASLSRTVSIGVWAGVIGAGASLVSLFGAASTLLVTLLANPQVGLQVTAATGTASPYMVSAIDAVSIMSLLLTLTAELLVVSLSLWIAYLIDGSTKASTDA